jgi:hypothetical protein
LPLAGELVLIQAMLVGLNYPYAWNIYGRYFGGGNPPGAEPLIDHWTDHLRTNLVTLRDTLGMTVVRIFLMCNANNYGVAEPGAVEQPRSVPGPMLAQLARMFEVFAETRLLVIPSIIDFKAFGRFKILSPARSLEPRTRAIDNGCGDRDAILTDPEQRSFFLDEVVRRFAAIAARFTKVIHSMEIINEPRWNIGALFNPDHIAGGLKIPKADMLDFLNRALEIMKESDLPSTVGHRFRGDLKEMPSGTRPQFHYYPLRAKRLGPLRIPRAIDPILKDRSLEFAGATGAFLGEIGTSAAHGEPWPELHGADAGGTYERVLERLKFVRSRNYPLVLLWPDVEGQVFNPGLPGGGPDPIHLSAEAQKGVIAFLKAS